MGFIDTYNLATHGLNQPITISTYTIATQGFSVQVTEQIEQRAPINVGGSARFDEEEYKKIIKLRLKLPTGKVVKHEVEVKDIDLTVRDVSYDVENHTVVLRMGNTRMNVEDADIPLIKINV